MIFVNSVFPTGNGPIGEMEGEVYQLADEDSKLTATQMVIEEYGSSGIVVGKRKEYWRYCGGRDVVNSKLGICWVYRDLFSFSAIVSALTFALWF